MSEIINFNVYRTIRILFNAEYCVVKLTKQTNSDTYALFAANDLGTKSWRHFYGKDRAEAFASASDDELGELVRQVIRGLEYG